MNANIMYVQDKKWKYFNIVNVKFKLISIFTFWVIRGEICISACRSKKVLPLCYSINQPKEIEPE